MSRVWCKYASKRSEEDAFSVGLNQENIHHIKCLFVIIVGAVDPKGPSQ